MQRVLTENWALLLGMWLLMVANGLLVVLLTLRGAGLGFTPLTISVMQGCYPLGALIGTMLTPRLVERVGHIRVFSALSATVSAAVIFHLLTEDAVVWSAMRLIAGFCFPGLYVIVESWLNAQAENRYRAQILSVYFIIQSIGPATGMALAGLPDPSGAVLFGMVSILLSIAVVPLLLSGVSAPEYSAPERMSVRGLMQVSPMAVLGILAVAVAIGAWFIGLPLHVLGAGLSDAQASRSLVIAMLAAALVQYPIAWIADRVERRLVVVGMSLTAAAAALWMSVDLTPAHIPIGFAIIGAATLPIYSLLVAHANDHLKPAQIVRASGAMAFSFQLGQTVGVAIGPLVAAQSSGRGLPLFVLGAVLGVVAIGAVRRSVSAPPSETGEVVATAILGTAQPGVIQAEILADQPQDHQRP